MPRVQGRLRKACQHVMSHVFAVFSYPAAFVLRHYLIVFHEDEFLPEHLLPWGELAMLGLSAKVRWQYIMQIEMSERELRWINLRDDLNKWVKTDTKFTKFN